MQVIEIQELGYPYFVDVRPDSMDEESPMVANLPAVTLQWVSPLALDAGRDEDQEVTVLLQSTDQAWLRADTDVQPNPELYPQYGFPVEGEQEARALAVAMRGSFESYYKDNASPFEAGEVPTDTVASALGTVEASPESSRLVVVGSSEFIDDAVLELSRNLAPERYLNNLQFMQNAVDWSVEDEDLLTIRSGGSYARLLQPLDNAQRATWMWANYAFALLALVAIGGVWYLRRRGEQPMDLVESSELGEPSSMEGDEKKEPSDPGAENAKVLRGGSDD
jgi:ABC-2 type transport system permease protein